MLTPGSRAPDFELDRFFGAQDGRTELWSLTDLIARGPVFLVFAKEACPTCHYALPLVDRIFQNYPGSRASLVVIAQEEESGARKLVDDLELHLPVLLDPEPHPVSEQYDLSTVPAFFYLGADGRIENVVEGFAREELMEINEKIAASNGLNAVPFFSPEEGVPAFRPG